VRLAAVIGQRMALHWLGRLSSAGLCRRPVDDTGMLHESTSQVPRMHEVVLVALGHTGGGARAEGSVADGVLRAVVDDLPGARTQLSEATLTTGRPASCTHAVWAYVWLSRAEFLLGSWDRASVAAERAVTLLEESGHEWLRPLARWAAMSVPAARGDWRAAEEHVRLAGAQAGDYELMIVAGGLARAQLAAARSDPEGVLRALEPVLAIGPRDGVDEPGFWPWQALYGDALVSTGELEQAEQFLAPHEELAAARGRRSSIAMLAAVRGRLEAAQGRPEAATAAFRYGLEQLEQLPLPFNQALLSLAYGQVLRRQGHRRAAAEQLQAAHDRFAELGAQPYLERSERELSACGLTPAKRHTFDPSQLTAQELAVARLVAGGMSNRQVASELFVSIKTVQFHLTHIYTKLRITNRAELAAVFPLAKRGDEAVISGCRHTSARRSGGCIGDPEPTGQAH
jgi:ATP/maltotriose-dependent transcriptional regulator MalT